MSHRRSLSSGSNNFFYVSSSLVDKGVDAYNDGEYERAIKCFSTALKAQRLTLGDDDICIAHTLGNYGAACLSAGHNDEALDILKECLQIKLKLKGKKSKSKDYVITITDTLNNLGNAAFFKDKNKEAMTFYQQCLTELTSGDVPGTEIEIANALYNIGTVHTFLEELDDALLALEESLNLVQKVYGQEHHLAIETLEKMGSIYLYQGQTEDAMATFMDVLGMSKAAYGSDHVDCAPSMYNIGLAYEAKGDKRRAMESYRSALSIYKKNGIDNPSVDVIRQRMVAI